MKNILMLLALFVSSSLCSQEYSDLVRKPFALEIANKKGRKEAVKFLDSLFSQVPYGQDLLYKIETKRSSVEQEYSVISLGDLRRILYHRWAREMKGRTYLRNFQKKSTHRWKLREKAKHIRQKARWGGFILHVLLPEEKHKSKE